MGGATIDSPDVIMEYADPTPPCGCHRYMLMVFEQDKALDGVNTPFINAFDATDPNARANFDVDAFTESPTPMKQEPVATFLFRVGSTSSDCDEVAADATVSPALKQISSATAGPRHSADSGAFFPALAVSSLMVLGVLATAIRRVGMAPTPTDEANARELQPVSPPL